jgi:hypothetical protein
LPERGCEEEGEAKSDMGYSIGEGEEMGSLVY